MFKTRLLSSIVLMLLALLFVIAGGNYLLAACAVLSCIAMMEFLRMLKLHKTFYAVTSYIVLAVLYGSLLFESMDKFAGIVVLYLMTLMIIYVVSFPKFNMEDMMYPLFALFYTGVLLSYIYRVRMLPGGAFSVWLIFIAAWGSDTCAYCAGMMFGKHKAFPVLSPKKTWEGCLGGVIGAALLAMLYCLIINKCFLQEHSLIRYALVCACGAVISQIGDLTASAMKRNKGIKDYGKLIPGHGGVLDRFDSVIFVAPIVFYLLQMTA